MNLLSLLSSFLPLFLQLIQTPAFQAIVKQIEADMHAKMASGIPPEAAAQQAGGLLGAAAMLHLTGNPVADFRALVAKTASSTGTPPGQVFPS